MNEVCVGKATKKAKRGASPPALSDKDTVLLVGTRLKHARLNRRIHLRQLASEVGCTESFLSKVENDKVRPTLTTLHKIVKALDISIAKLFAEPEPSTVVVLRAGTRVTLLTGQSPLGEGIALEALVPLPHTGSDRRYPCAGGRLV